MYGREFENVREKYNEDIIFRQLVDHMYHMIATGQATLHEMRQAATYAGIKYEMYNVKPLLLPSDKAIPSTP